MKKSRFQDICISYLNKNGLVGQVDPEVNFSPDMAVVIPCYNEPNIESSLQSLLHACVSDLRTMIIVVINAPESAPEDIVHQNESTLSFCKTFGLKHNSVFFCVIPLMYHEWPAKDAGVGLARKTGMDYAIKLMQLYDNNGIICCFDADSRCDVNYFQAIKKEFNASDIDAVSVYYEHPLHGDDYEVDIYDAITAYELHLRYYIAMQRWLGLPYAYHTLGSSMAVRGSSYCLYGGMNRRKAGEDFYFLHKFISKGKFGEVNETRVIPSPRISDRVPFGTGKAVGDLLRNAPSELMTYNPITFEYLKSFVDHLESFYYDNVLSEAIPEPLSLYFIHSGIQDKVVEIRKYTSDFRSFRKRFFQWFDAFALMKFTHFFRDHYFPNIKVNEAANRALFLIQKEDKCLSNVELLQIMRDMDRLGHYK